MSFQLDPNILAAITEEARQCFLDEDAPQYLQALQLGVQQNPQNLDFIPMLQAAHSIKGGAGLAGLSSLQELAHKLEDVMEAIQKDRIKDVEVAWELVAKSIDEVAFILSQARTTPDIEVDNNLITALESLVKGEDNSQPEIASNNSVSGNNLVVKALTEDLEQQLLEIEELTADLPPEILQEAISNFYDECMFLGETLDLPWLVEKATSLGEVLQVFPPDQTLLMAQELISELRSQRDDYLTEMGLVQPIQDMEDTTVIPEPIEDTIILQASTIVTQKNTSQAQLRIPLQRVETMTNDVEELILIQSRLNLGQKQLQQSQNHLLKLNLQFEPIREQVQVFYNQLAIGQRSSNNNSSVALTSDEDDFDALELDRYTELHTTLQSFQELMVQIQETRNDIALINRNLAENLEQVRRNVDGLYKNLTDSRLVPFLLLAKRFIPQIQSLNIRYDKSVNLEIVGENTLVDQVLLEQLQTPLTHLINNAFDHGIESIPERLALEKSTIATITLEATVQNSELVIVIQDDGRGIDLNKVYQKALAKKIIASDWAFEEFDSQEILDWIFLPEFSTADRVSNISGRGMGMDIVRSQIRKLRGSINVDTKLDQGTTFTLRLPVNLSLTSLLLVQLQNRIIAIPTRSIQDNLLYRELDFVNGEKSLIRWQNQQVSLIPLSQLLPCPRQPFQLTQPKVVIILEQGSKLIGRSARKRRFAIAVDSLIAEEELIVKPFDDTILIPPYLAGCTILGTGEVVPVLLPQGFDLSSIKTDKNITLPSVTTASTISTVLIAEDSVATRKMLEKILVSVGLKVIVCRDGQEALEQFQVNYSQINLVISDVEMPRLNGFELLEKIKQHPVGLNIPVVMATSRTGDRHRKQAMELGATGYLGKPVNPQKLLATIQSLS
ncbi:MAG: hybrid sensor histidine kinase/response regulator [Xenococcaceae cyanobacterium MO_207.B15]|nr:hybrid sensor histidine kinase/response regulator [Xenococcaceae cyanobacterium MO_207.B15]